MNLKMLISYIFLLLLIISTLGKKCDHILCSNVFDEVCGIAELKNRNQIRSKYKNYCLMKKAECEEESVVEINQVENQFCNLTQRRNMLYGSQDNNSTRVKDFGIVGAHQACNHTCPTYCADTYEPACAKIWKNERSYTMRPMINHCHIDLYSCATGVKVTIEALSACYKNPMNLVFMQNIAAMKSLKLLDFSSKQGNRRKRNTALRDEDGNAYRNNWTEIVKIIHNTYHELAPQTSDPEISN